MNDYGVDPVDGEMFIGIDVARAFGVISPQEFLDWSIGDASGSFAGKVRIIRGIIYVRKSDLDVLVKGTLSIVPSLGFKFKIPMACVKAKSKRLCWRTLSVRH